MIWTLGLRAGGHAMFGRRRWSPSPQPNGAARGRFAMSASADSEAVHAELSKGGSPSVPAPTRRGCVRRIIERSDIPRRAAWSGRGPAPRPVRREIMKRCLPHQRWTRYTRGGSWFTSLLVVRERTNQTFTEPLRSWTMVPVPRPRPKTWKAFVNGEWVSSKRATGGAQHRGMAHSRGAFHDVTPAQLEVAIAAAHRAFEPYRLMRRLSARRSWHASPRGCGPIER